MRFKFLILTICFMVLAPRLSSAEGEELYLLVNELKIFSVYELHRVAVSDPNVADVTVLSDKELMLIAKGVGTTSVVIWDKSGQRSFEIIVAEKDLEKPAQRIRELLVSSDIRGVRVKTEQENVYVTGEVLTEGELEKVKDAVAPFTSVVNLVKRRERQPLVEIDINVLEVAYDDEKTLGINWSDSVTYTEPSSSGPRTPGSPYDPKTHTTGKFAKLWRVFKWDRSTVTAQLNFLIEEDQARTLANPKLVTLSGKEASFLVGGEIPYLTVETEGRTKVEWKDYGITLKIKPTVNSKNEIRTQIKAEVSDLDAANAVTHQGYNIPAFKTRETETELFLNDGDTVFIAGLIKNEDSENINRLPWLSRVPILGELFKSTQFQNKRTELVISITPTIIGEKATPDYLASEMLKQEAILESQRRFSAYSEESTPVVYYIHMIEDIIARTVVYPEEALHDQQEGIVKVSLRLLPNGQLKKAIIKESSGYKTLDDAALGAVQKLAPYPSFPAEVTQPELHLTVPVVFKNYVRNE